MTCPGSNKCTASSYPFPPQPLCNVERQARVSGRLKHGKFFADSFVLLPADSVPDNPEFTEADKH